ncbi:helix-turn-helix transcriptional regulator [Paenibacillus sinopodophylli]|uniref:helix-turn-helix transcriptional regulator n=1 Tax=Paenibacillus sinopodophylli TaxID=1837342 RepID=UPI00110C99ED|nr:HTH domain-containing protein [Paenibacillus sinopodophylli]
MRKHGRQSAIVLELQQNKLIKAEELAALFDTSVRTIYRDIQMLSESGVPIIGVPGTGYSIMEDYFLPPISFSVEETLTILMGTEFIEQRFNDKFGQSARSARAKIESILTPIVQYEADRIRESVRVLYHEKPKR